MQGSSRGLWAYPLAVIIVQHKWGLMSIPFLKKNKKKLEGFRPPCYQRYSLASCFISPSLSSPIPSAIMPRPTPMNQNTKGRLQSRPATMPIMARAQPTTQSSSWKKFIMGKSSLSFVVSIIHQKDAVVNSQFWSNILPNFPSCNFGDYLL